MNLKPYTALSIAALLTLSGTSAFAGEACCARKSTAAVKSISPTQTKVEQHTSAGGADVETISHEIVTTATQGQVVEISVSDKYEPSKVEAVKDRPLALRFTRKDGNNCAGVVEIPAYGIKKELPAGQTTEVAFTPNKTGTVDFHCAMKMVRGQIVVK